MDNALFAALLGFAGVLIGLLGSRARERTLMLERRNERVLESVQSFTVAALRWYDVCYLALSTRAKVGDRRLSEVGTTLNELGQRMQDAQDERRHEMVQLAVLCSDELHSWLDDSFLGRENECVHAIDSAWREAQPMPPEGQVYLPLLDEAMKHFRRETRELRVRTLWQQLVSGRFPRWTR